MQQEAVPIIFDNKNVHITTEPVPSISNIDISLASTMDITETRFANQQNRTRIQVDHIDFVTMHNLLYFLYTGRVNLHFANVEAQSLIGYPDKADAFDLYRASDFYGLQSLAQRCFQFLMNTRTRRNICPRLFHIDCKPFKALQEGYNDFLLQHFEEIKKTEDWKSVFNNWTELALEEQNYRVELMLHITSRLSFIRST